MDDCMHIENLPTAGSGWHNQNEMYQTGAGEEARTLDLNLGKVALYQLSYSRINNRRTLYISGPDCQEILFLRHCSMHNFL